MSTEAQKELDRQVQATLVGTYGENHDLDLTFGKTCRRLAEDLIGRYDHVNPVFTKAIDGVVAGSNLDSPTRLGVLIESLKRLGNEKQAKQLQASFQSITEPTH